MNIFLLASLLAASAVSAGGAPPADLDRYNVVWLSPGQDDRSAMPLGNGRTGVNLWVERDGGVSLYLVRNDSLSEASRLLKVGRITLRLDPNPFSAGNPFRQELLLGEGRIVITAGEPDRQVRLSIFCDAESDVIYIVAEAGRPVKASLRVENWRRTERVLTPEEVGGTRMYQGAPKDIVVRECADAFPGSPDAVLWFHHNTWSPVEHHLKYQHMEAFRRVVPDPVLHRTSGARIWGEGFTPAGDDRLESAQPTRRFCLRILTLSERMANPQEAYPVRTAALAKGAAPPEEAAARTAAWWREFWQRSWIFVDEGEPAQPLKDFPADPAPPSRITQAWLLARFVAACQARSEFPIHFQGGMFIIGNEHMPIPRRPNMDRSRITPDFCFHGSQYWWQNTRLVYHPMLAQGDYAPVRRYLDYYLSLQPVFESIVRAEYGAGGAQGLLMREMMTVFGLPTQVAYGWNAQTYSNGYTRDVWQQPLELGCQMLDYVDYTGDRALLREKIVPFCLQALRFFETRFGRDAGGRLLIKPSHAVETYWTGVENDMPSVAGLHALTRRLLALPAPDLAPDQRKAVERIAAVLPPVPFGETDGKRRLEHAGRYEPKRGNYEDPSLYAVFPFGLYGLARGELDAARESYRLMKSPGHFCWFQTGLFAARLGLAEEAAEDVRQRASRLAIPGFRFPGYFNSAFDSPPDLDGAGNLQMTLQEMLLQPAGDKILLLPAWPREWNADFRLHAPLGTVVEGKVRKGGLVDLKVTPESRRKDVRVSQVEPKATLP